MSSRVTLEVFLLRHGESEINRLQATWPAPKQLLWGCNTYSELTPEGVAEAKKLGRALRRRGLTLADFDRLVSSTTVRAQQTARHCIAALVARRTPYADLGRIELAPALAELSQGRLEGKPCCLIARTLRRLRKTPDKFWTYRAGPGAESQSDVYQRAARWLQENVVGRGHRRVLLFTHENVIKFLLAGLFRLPSERAFRLKLPNASITILRYRGRQLLDASGPGFRFTASPSAPALPVAAAAPAAG